MKYFKIFAADNTNEKSRGIFLDAAKQLNEKYFNEHGHYPPDYIGTFPCLALICIVCTCLICHYVFFDIPYTKHLIKKGEIEDNGLIADIVRKIVLFLVIVIGMGIYTVFTWTYPGYLISMGIGLIIGLIFSGFTDRNKKHYFERYHKKIELIERQDKI